MRQIPATFLHKGVKSKRLEKKVKRTKEYGL